MILQKAMKGELDLMGAAKAVQDELLSIPDFGGDSDSLFAEEYKLVESFKKAILMVAGSAAQKLMMDLPKEQEVLMNIADMAIDAYTSESLLLRVHNESIQLEMKDKMSTRRWYKYIFMTRLIGLIRQEKRHCYLLRMEMN